YQQEQALRLLQTNLLFTIAAQGNAPMAAQLLEQGVEVDARNEAGETALMLAVRAGHEEVVRLLLQAGASRLVREAQERTVLTIAADAGQIAILRLLLAQPVMPMPSDEDPPPSVPPTEPISPSPHLPPPAPPQEDVEARILPPEQEVDCDCDVRL